MQRIYLSKLYERGRLVDVLHTRVPSKRENFERFGIVALFTLGIALTSVGVGAFLGALCCTFAWLTYGLAFADAWNLFGFALGVVVTIVAFVVVTFLLVMLSLDGVMSDTASQPHVE